MRVTREAVPRRRDYPVSIADRATETPAGEDEEANHIREPLLDGFSIRY